METKRLLSLVDIHLYINSVPLSEFLMIIGGRICVYLVFRT